MTAPQSLFLMNSGEIDKATAAFAERLKKASDGDLKVAVDLAYRIAIARPPSRGGAGAGIGLPRQ